MGLGRLKLRWNDQVTMVIRRLGADINIAEDTVVWKREVHEMKNHLRFVTPQQ